MKHFRQSTKPDMQSLKTVLTLLLTGPGFGKFWLVDGMPGISFEAVAVGISGIRPACTDAMGYNLSTQFRYRRNHTAASTTNSS